MGNSLLDFVMALVRDPAAAARYAADPDGVLAAAGLPDVTTADVSSLIPMVTDSLAMSSPGFSGVVVPVVGQPADGVNVWASGAATAAFDAFGIEPPAPPWIAVNSIDGTSIAGNSTDRGTPAAPAGDLGETSSAPDPAMSPEAVPMSPEAVPMSPEAVPWGQDGDPGEVVDPHPAIHHPDAHPGESPAFDLF